MIQIVGDSNHTNISLWILAHRTSDDDDDWGVQSAPLNARYLGSMKPFSGLVSQGAPPGIDSTSEPLITTDIARLDAFWSTGAMALAFPSLRPLRQR